MSAMYSDQSSSFDNKSRELIRATLDERLHRAAPASASVTRVAHATVAIVVDAKGAAMIGGQPVDNDSLKQLLKMSYDDDHDTEVVVHAAKGVPPARIVEILDVAKGVGLVKASFQRD